MALADLLAQENVVNCDGNDVGGMGNQACPFDWDRIVTAEFSKPNFVYEDAQDLVYINEQIQLGNLHIVNGYESFASTTPDPNINTVEGSGYQQVMGEMPTSFTGTLNVGVERWKALRTLNGKDNWNVALYDVSGNKIYTKSKAGASKGFSVKMLFTGMYKGKEGNNPSVQTQMIQLTTIKEMERMTYITGSTLDFDAGSDLNDWNPVNITINPITAPATTLVFKAMLVDNSHLVQGLAIADLRLRKTVAGVTTSMTPSAISYTTNEGFITLTIPATTSGDVYTLDTYDTVLATNIIDLVGVLYKAEPATVTV